MAAWLCVVVIALSGFRWKDLFSVGVVSRYFNQNFVLQGFSFFYFLCSRLTVPSLPLLACDVVRCWGSVTPCRENTNLRSWWRSLLTWPRGTNRTLLTSSLRWDLCLAWRKGHMTRVSYFGTVIWLKQKELRLFIKNVLGLFWLLSATVTRPSTLGLVSPGVGCRGDGGSLHRLITSVWVCCRSVRLWRTTLVNGEFYSLNSKFFFFLSVASLKRRRSANECHT